MSLLVLLVAACGDAPTEPPEPEAAPAEPVAEVAIDEDELDRVDIEIIPSMQELQSALEAAGIQTSLGTLIPRRTYDLARTDRDVAAVRTGVVVADVSLTLRTAEKAELVQRLETIKAGMKRLDAGQDAEDRLTRLIQLVQTDSATRDELVASFREFSLRIVEDLLFVDRETVVPLIEAGAYLEGANLVARALQSTPSRTGGDDLLKQTKAVNHFIEYVSVKAATKLSRDMRDTLLDVLTNLKTVAEKPGPLTDEDLTTVIKSTETVLAYL